MARIVIIFYILTISMVLANCAGTNKSEVLFKQNISSYLHLPDPASMNYSWLSDQLEQLSFDSNKILQICQDDYNETLTDNIIYNNLISDVFDKVIAERAIQRWNISAERLENVFNTNRSDRFVKIKKQIDSLTVNELMLMVRIPLSYPQAILINEGFEISNCLNSNQYAVYQNLEQKRSELWTTHVQNLPPGNTNVTNETRGRGRRNRSQTAN